MAGAMAHRALCWLTLACLTGWAAPLYAFELSQVERSVVRILVQTPRGTGHGSGTVLNANGDVLTNWHVTTGSSSLSVISEFSNGEQPAQLVWESEEKDLAVIRAPSLSLPAASLFSGEPEKGAPVYSLGYPAISDFGAVAWDVTVTGGVLSRIFNWPQPDWNVEALQHDAQIFGGNSGGPLFDNCGRVIGVNTAGPHEGESFVNWSSHIKEAIALLRARGIEFSDDASPCVSPAPGSAGVGVDEQARAQAEQATQAVEDVRGGVESATQTAQDARTQAEQATQAVDEVRGGVESATQTAQDAQAQAEQAAQAVEEARQAGRLTNTLVGLVAVVTLVALGLALRKPRQEIIRMAGQVAGQIAAPLSRLARSARRKKPDIALTGFDAQGRPVTLMLSRAELDTQQGGFTVGRHSLLVDHVLNGERLSKRHARFSGNNGSVFVEDLNSSNGTHVNGRACPPFQPMQIRPGDMIDVGGVELRVSS